MADQNRETAQPEQAPEQASLPRLPWLSLQFDQEHEYSLNGITVVTGRVATRRHRIWVAAVKGSDLRAGRGGFGRNEGDAVRDLFRWLRDRYAPPPP